MVGVPWRRQTDAYAHELLSLVFHKYVVLRSGCPHESGNSKHISGPTCNGDWQSGRSIHSYSIFAACLRMTTRHTRRQHSTHRLPKNIPRSSAVPMVSCRQGKAVLERRNQM